MGTGLRVVQGKISWEEEKESIDGQHYKEYAGVSLTDCSAITVVSQTPGSQEIFEGDRDIQRCRLLGRDSLDRPLNDVSSTTHQYIMQACTCMYTIHDCRCMVRSYRPLKSYTLRVRYTHLWIISRSHAWTLMQLQFFLELNASRQFVLASL